METSQKRSHREPQLLLEWTDSHTGEERSYKACNLRIAGGRLRITDLEGAVIEVEMDGIEALRMNSLARRAVPAV